MDLEEVEGLKSMVNSVHEGLDAEDVKASTTFLEVCIRYLEQLIRRQSSKRASDRSRSQRHPTDPGCAA